MIIRIKFLAKKIYGLSIIGQSKQILKLASLDELVRIKSDLSSEDAKTPKSADEINQ